MQTSKNFIKQRNLFKPQVLGLYSFLISITKIQFCINLHLKAVKKNEKELFMLLFLFRFLEFLLHNISFRVQTKKAFISGKVFMRIRVNLNKFNEL